MSINFYCNDRCYDWDKKYVEILFNDDNLVIVTSFLEEEGLALLLFFEKDDVLDENGEKKPIGDIIDRTKVYMAFSNLNQVANFMETLKSAAKPLIEREVLEGPPSGQ